MLRLIPLALLLMTSCGKYDPQGDIYTINQRLNDLEHRVNTYIVRLDNLDQAIASIDRIDLELLHVNLNTALARIDDLESNVTIESIHSPCPTSKEVILELTDGRVLAYFEQGHSRYLSFLEAGTYRTTDNTSCTFTIN